jgi:hypothetical protein
LEPTYDIDSPLDVFVVFLKLLYLFDIDGLVTLQNIIEILSLASRFELTELISRLKLRLWKLTNGSFPLYESYLSTLNLEISTELPINAAIMSSLFLFDTLYEQRSKSGDFNIYLDIGKYFLSFMLIVCHL